MCCMILDTSPQLHAVHLRIPQNLSRVLHTEKLEQQIRREIAACSNHSFCERGNFRCSSNRLVQFRHRIRVAVEVKRRAVCCADKTISHVQRVIELKSPLVCRAKSRKKHCDLDRARSMKPTVATQRKSQTALEIVQRYGRRPSFVFSSQSFHLLA